MRNSGSLFVFCGGLAGALLTILFIGLFKSNESWSPGEPASDLSLFRDEINEQIVGLDRRVETAEQSYLRLERTFGREILELRSEVEEALAEIRRELAELRQLGQNSTRLDEEVEGVVFDREKGDPIGPDKARYRKALESAKRDAEKLRESILSGADTGYSTADIDLQLSRFGEALDALQNVSSHFDLKLWCEETGADQIAAVYKNAIDEEKRRGTDPE